VSLIAGHTLLVLDTETTGFSPAPMGRDRLVEVAYVKVVNAAVGEEWSSLVRPGIPIPPEATRIHGIGDAEVASAPGYAEIGRRLREACADHVLVFHNAPFDLPFLRDLFREAGVPPLLNPVLDTLGLARQLGDSGSNRLGDVARRLQVPARTAHRALGDALMTADVLLGLLAKPKVTAKVASLSELAAASQDTVRTTGRR